MRLRLARLIEAGKRVHNLGSDDVTAIRDTCVKYFFLSEGWTIGRVWELGGLWNESAWRRKPQISQVNLCVWEQGEKLWLYRVEEAVLMVEVKPTDSAQVDAATQAIGQVVLKRLITADQAIERLCAADAYQPETKPH